MNPGIPALLFVGGYTRILSSDNTQVDLFPTTPTLSGTIITDQSGNPITDQDGNFIGAPDPESDS